MKKSAKSVAATIGSLALKGMVKTLNEEDGYYFDGYITEDGIKALEQKVEKSVKKETKQEKKTDKPAKKETFAAKETKKVGDLHKMVNGYGLNTPPVSLIGVLVQNLNNVPARKLKPGKNLRRKGSLLKRRLPRLLRSKLRLRIPKLRRVLNLIRNRLQLTNGLLFLTSVLS